MVFEFFLMTAEFTETGIFFDQELFTLRSQRLRGEISESFFITDAEFAKDDRNKICAIFARIQSLLTPELF